MKIAVSSTGTNLDSSVDLRFGRTQYFIIVDSDTSEYETIQNPYMSASGGAGIQAAQMIGNRGVQAVISGILGPNAFQTLRTIGVPMYQVTGGSVREAITAFQSNQLNQIQQPGPAHAGMGMGRGFGMGIGRAGRRGGGKNIDSSQPFHPPIEQNNQTVSQMESKKNEIDQLKQQANQLNQELLDIMNRIRQLELKATETPNKNE